MFVVLWSDHPCVYYDLIFLVFFCDILFSCGDFEYLWALWIVAFNSVEFLQVRVFRSYICLVEIAYLRVWVWDLSDSSFVCFVLHRSTILLGCLH